jgi:general secretion pathway protein F
VDADCSCFDSCRRSLALTQESFRQKFDAAWLRLPLVGKLARGYNAARFAGTLAMLAGAGVPILKALQAAAETLNNRAMRADALDALVLVREGAPLASALAQKKRFPGLVSMFARLGEQTGQLPLMLQRAATQLHRGAAPRHATGHHPGAAAHRGMGLIVMLIVLAVLQPIIELNQLREITPRQKNRTMAVTLDDKLVVAISSRALFDFEEENRVFDP